MHQHERVSPVLDENGLTGMFDGKTLLITGGTGSFGNTVLKRFLDTGIREIRVFSRDEKKQDDMRKRYTKPAVRKLGLLRRLTRFSF